MEQVQRSVVLFKEWRRLERPPLRRSSTVLALGVILVVFSVVMMAHWETVNGRETAAYRQWVSQPVRIGEPPVRYEVKYVFPNATVGAVVFLFGLVTLIVWYAMYTVEGRFEGDCERESLL